MKVLCRFIVGMLTVIMLVSCATAYKKSGITGGYGETKIDDSHYLVYFDGNGYASKDRVWYFWIYRCAQLTRDRGYTYFSIEPAQDNISKTAFDPEQPGRLYPAVLVGDANGRVVNVRGGGSVGGFVYVPGATITTWHSKAIVAMYNDDVPQKKVIMRAQLVLDMLAEYVKTSGSSTPPLHSAIFEQSAFALAPGNQIANIHQYLLAHPPAAPAGANPLAQRGTSWLSPSSANPGMTLATPRLPAPPSPSASPLIAHADSPNVSMAQGVANQLGCGAVQANGDATYMASCGSYSVLISCEDGHCHPLHTIQAKSSE
jgi:hypothetical protein